MKDIGESFKEARKTIGLSKEEVMKDLNITSSQFENLEDGNANAFKDIFFLKDLVRKYTKYLNLDEDKIMDEFNNFIFGYTSKIPIDDILEQTREINLLEKASDEKKIVSPYTVQRKEKTGKYILLYSLIAIVLIIIAFLVINLIKTKNENKIEYVRNNYLVERRI